MALRIEDYALIGDCETAALVGRDGSIDWLCLPRFDSGACFASLLGKPDNGRWLLAPAGEVSNVRRRYRDGTFVLETTFETAAGVVTLIDCMAVRGRSPVVVRCVRGDHGKVPMHMELVVRFDYGSVVPWVRRTDEGLKAIAGPDTLLLRTDVEMRGEDMTTVADFTVAEGQTVPFTLAWHPSFDSPSTPLDPHAAVEEAEAWWRDWSKGCKCMGPYGEDIRRSLLALKALIYAPTGGVAAAVTTSLPEKLGGVRNWDYRYCWLRDATFTLYALMAEGYREEAKAWRQWLLRAVAGSPDKIQIMYGISGERRLSEWEVGWLDGYEGARPVRIGNAASGQFQLDVYGELLDAMYQSRRIGIEEEQAAWNLELALLKFLETAWEQPDEGIWEVRGPRRPFTHSKVMAWVAFDRAVKAVENFKLEGPVDRWRQVRDTIHQQVCRQGFNADMNSFVQYYGSDKLDAALLMIPLVGFLPPDDPRVKGTVAAIEQHLMSDGFVLRYRDMGKVDGLPPGEGVFLPCTCWLIDNWVLQGRVEEADKLYRRVLGLCNDVGLISEEYDPKAKRLVGNFPQAFTHVGLINTALNLTAKVTPAEHRAG